MVGRVTLSDSKANALPFPPLAMPMDGSGYNIQDFQKNFWENSLVVYQKPVTI